MPVNLTNFTQLKHLGKGDSILLKKSKGDYHDIYKRYFWQQVQMTIWILGKTFHELTWLNAIDLN